QLVDLDDGSIIDMSVYLTDEEYRFAASFYEANDVEEAKEVYELLCDGIRSGEFGGPERRFIVKNSENRQSIGVNIDTEEIPFFYGDAETISFK
ncbi:MAG: hypothetical protein IKE51_05005, partial [Solobacterium sp.]|nr:hypothetical protein [Solobacterium sp.]